jgi:hypothetical protein
MVKATSSDARQPSRTDGSRRMHLPPPWSSAVNHLPPHQAGIIAAPSCYDPVAEVLNFERIKSRQSYDRRLLESVDRCCRYPVIRVPKS